MNGLFDSTKEEDCNALGFATKTLMSKSSKDSPDLVESKLSFRFLFLSYF